MFKTTYDPTVDAFAVYFGQKGATVESAEVAPGVTLDFDANGQVIGIEVLNVQQRMATTEHATAPATEHAAE
jgi:uncharacterized protein YuzE